MQSNNQVAKITNELIGDDQDPASWVSWLFDVQNSLIANGSTSSLTQKGSVELSDRFACLKNFFVDLQNLQMK